MVEEYMAIRTSIVTGPGHLQPYWPDIPGFPRKVGWPSAWEATEDEAAGRIAVLILSLEGAREDEPMVLNFNARLLTRETRMR